MGLPGLIFLWRLRLGCAGLHDSTPTAAINKQTMKGIRRFFNSGLSLNLCKYTHNGLLWAGHCTNLLINAASLLLFNDNHT